MSTQAPSLEVMAENATERLARGNDVVWAWWLTGGMYADLAIVCCPNRDTTARCPLGR